MQLIACARARHRGQRGQAHLAQRLCPPRGSGTAVSRRRGTRGRCHYLSAPLTRIHDIVLVAILVEQRLRVAARRRVHCGRARRGRAQLSGGGGGGGGYASERAGRGGGRLAVNCSSLERRTGGDAGQIEVRTRWPQRAWRAHAATATAAVAASTTSWLCTLHSGRRGCGRWLLAMCGSLRRALCHRRTLDLARHSHC